ncbi:MAG: [FeFe] hydrogenase H-cluster radical SAM maturase HydG [Candidatus Margulisiibacteriota bacterium]
MIINEKKINDHLNIPCSDPIEKIIERSLEIKGLTLPETARLLLADDKKQIKKIFSAARAIKERIYGRRLVLFAPLYTTNECQNNCLYCAFRKANRKLKRKSLSLEEIREEVLALESQGHKRILLVAGEDPAQAGIGHLEKIIATIYGTKSGRGEIRRVNVNVAPLSLPDFRRLKRTGIGTYQLFQETYHRETYRRCHPSGPKADYEFRLTAMDRALKAGINDVGIGALFGLYDYKFEALALLMHARYLDSTYNVGPHTISVPRIEPAEGAPLANRPPYPVSDLDFKKLVAVLRLAVPYTGIILSTRETADLRNELFSLGVSQISAASRTNPGGYSADQTGAQFTLYDSRSTAQVIKDILRLGYLPSFCTACYRLGRTGEDFMDLAKPGSIGNLCLPNSLLTFKEYLLDYGDQQLKIQGQKVIEREIRGLKSSRLKDLTRKKIAELESGKRDLFF